MYLTRQLDTEWEQNCLPYACRMSKRKRYIYWDILDTSKGSCSLNKHKKLLQCHNTNATARAWEVVTSTIPEITVYIKKWSVQPVPFCTVHTLTLYWWGHITSLLQLLKDWPRQTKSPINFPIWDFTLTKFFRVSEESRGLNASIVTVSNLMTSV